MNGTTATKCLRHSLHTYATLAEAEAEVTRRKVRAAISHSAAPQVTAQQCPGGGWHVHRPIKPAHPGVLVHREPCRALARQLHQAGNDWRITATYVADETVTRDTACEVCQERRRVGQVHIAWSPAGSANCDEINTCTGCAPEYLKHVVSVDAGDCDVHRDLIDVEVRRAA